MKHLTKFLTAKFPSIFPLWGIKGAFRGCLLAALFPLWGLGGFSQTTIDSGTCGANLTWKLTNNGLLTISGSGAMDDYGLFSSPWNFYRNSIKTVVIDSGVTTIGNFAFFDCRNVTSVVIPNSVTTISYASFSDCYKLTSIIIPNSVTTIGVAAFAGSGLTTITIPSSVTAIGCKAFTDYDVDGMYYYTKLQSIICEATTPPIIDTCTFLYNAPATFLIYVPCNSLNAYQTANYWKYLTNFIATEDTSVTRYSVAICEGNVYSDSNFANLMKDSVYYRTLQNRNNCDSIVCLTLTVFPVPTVPIASAICQGNTCNFNGKLLTGEGIYYDTLQSINNCDSIIELTLIVNPVPPITRLFDSIRQGDTCYFHGKPLTNAGIYRDTLQTVHGCDSIIDLKLTITNVGIIPITNGELRIFPNPTNNQLKIERGKLKIEKIEIFNTVGQILLSLPSSPSPETIIDISHLPSGTYFLKINNKLTYKLIKK